jgi:magnesium chelatase family protein
VAHFLLTINLSPATLPKAGSHYDLAIVAAILAAQGIFRGDELRRTVFLGELGLDGRVRPVRGVLPATLAAQQAGFTRIIVPLRQAGEAKLVVGIEVFGIASITQLVALLRDEPMPLVDPIEVIGDPASKHAKRRLDLADVAGQVEAKWACEVAALFTMSSTPDPGRSSCWAEIGPNEFIPRSHGRLTRRPSP